MILAKDILFKQHPLFKWFFCLTLSLFIVIATSIKLLLLFAVVLLYLLLYPEIYKFWLNALMRILPLIIAILIFSLLSRNDFYNDLLLIARIAFLLLISVFLIKTSSLTELFAFLPEKMNPFKEFLTATLLFIPIFFESFAQAKKQSNNLSKIITICLEFTHNHIENIRQQIENPDNHIKLQYSWAADITGTVMLMITGFICFY
ncbi:MAG: hypothetical protein P9M05_07365 [Candidatus Stygibacter australis]|nr:hypothetical protein [Candidatus Stygibacter australis]